MFYVLNAIIYITIFFMGAVVFSYLNLVIERLPKKENILVRNVKCPMCDRELHAKDIFPIVSEIRYKGKCKYCREELPVRPMVIEVLGGLFAVGSSLFYGVTWQALFVFLVICDLVVISFIDMDTQEIPPQLNLILLVLGALSIIVLDGPGMKERIIGVFAVSVPMLLLAVLLNGFGGGDVKLMAASGLLLGWKGNVIAFFIGAIIGAIYAIYLLKTKKSDRKGYFAFGPFLCIGILVALIHNFGASLVTMYLDYLKSFKSMPMLFMSVIGI